MLCMYRASIIIFFKWCNLMRFGVYFAAIFSPKNAKMFIFYIKNIDIVLLRAKFRGIGAYSPKCLFIVQFGAFWSTFSEIFLLRKYEYLSNIDMDACMGGRGQE